MKLSIKWRYLGNETKRSMLRHLDDRLPRGGRFTWRREVGEQGITWTVTLDGEAYTLLVLHREAMAASNPPRRIAAELRALRARLGRGVSPPPVSERVYWKRVRAR